VGRWGALGEGGKWGVRWGALAGRRHGCVQLGAGLWLLWSWGWLEMGTRAEPLPGACCAAPFTSCRPSPWTSFPAPASLPAPGAELLERGGPPPGEDAASSVLRWDARLAATQASLSTQEPILSWRRQLAALPGSVGGVGELWLQHARLCRATGHTEAAMPAVLQAAACQVRRAALHCLVVHLPLSDVWALHCGKLTWGCSCCWGPGPWVWSGPQGLPGSGWETCCPAAAAIKSPAHLPLYAPPLPPSSFPLPARSHQRWPWSARGYCGTPRSPTAQSPSCSRWGQPLPCSPACRPGAARRALQSALRRPTCPRFRVRVTKPVRVTLTLNPSPKTLFARCSRLPLRRAAHPSAPRLPPPGPQLQQRLAEEVAGGGGAGCARQRTARYRAEALVQLAQWMGETGQGSVDEVKGQRSLPGLAWPDLHT
jgi:hypothetical protein